MCYDSEELGEGIEQLFLFDPEDIAPLRPAYDPPTFGERYLRAGSEEDRTSVVEQCKLFWQSNSYTPAAKRLPVFRVKLRDRLQREAPSGMTSIQLSGAFGCHRNTVARSKVLQKDRDKMKERIKNCRAEGHSMRKIGQMTGYSLMQVRWILA